MIYHGKMRFNLAIIDVKTTCTKSPGWIVIFHIQFILEPPSKVSNFPPLEQWSVSCIKSVEVLLLHP